MDGSRASCGESCCLENHSETKRFLPNRTKKCCTMALRNASSPAATEPLTPVPDCAAPVLALAHFI